MRKKIFLSYSLSDSDLVQQFKLRMNNEMQEFDFIEHNVVESTENEWKEQVTEKIKKSDVVLCLFGFSTWESEAVKWEVENAIKNDKKIVLVKLKPTVFMIPNYILDNKIKVIEEDVALIANQISIGNERN